MKEQIWTIQYGLKDYDCERVRVICNTIDELATICSGLVKYGEREIWHRPIACVAFKGESATFRKTADFMFCDCM